METAYDLLQAANQLLQERKFLKASEYYMLLINGGLENENILCNYAICQLNLENFEETYIGSNLSLALNPTLADMINLRAIASWKLNNFEKAKADFELAIKLGDTMAENNYAIFLSEYFNYLKQRLSVLNEDDIDINLDKAFYISPQHMRYENNKQVSNSKCDRAIKILKNPSDHTYNVTIYSLDKPHPVWKSYVNMAPKKMMVSKRNREMTKLDGVGFDSLGEPFSNYSLTLNHPLNRLENIIMHLNDQNVYVQYEISNLHAILSLFR